MAAVANGPLILRLLSASVSIAGRAGNIIKDIMKKGELGIVQKGLNDLQTEADRSAQRCIVSSLEKCFPNVAVIGEEGSLEAEPVSESWIVSQMNSEVLEHQCPEELKAIKEEDVVVWVDPLDGTSEYTQGLLDHVTVLIGIAVDGKAVGGVIHQPYFNYKTESDPYKMGRTMWGLIGLGAFGLEKIPPPEGQRIITTTRSHSNQLINTAIEAVKPDSILRVGGCGHKVLLLIEGQAHAYVFASAGCKKWDTCAPEALLHAVGGHLSDIHGNRIQYYRDIPHPNSGGVLATHDEAVHASYCSLIPQEVKDKLQS